MPSWRGKGVVFRTLGGYGISQDQGGGEIVMHLSEEGRGEGTMSGHHCGDRSHAPVRRDFLNNS